MDTGEAKKPIRFGGFRFSTRDRGAVLPAGSEQEPIGPVLAAHAKAIHEYCNERFFEMRLTSFERALEVFGYKIRHFEQPACDSILSIDVFALECAQVAVAKATTEYLYPRCGIYTVRWAYDSYIAGLEMALVREFLDFLPTLNLEVCAGTEDSSVVSRLVDARERFDGHSFDEELFREVLIALSHAAPAQYRVRQELPFDDAEDPEPDLGVQI